AKKSTPGITSLNFLKAFEKLSSWDETAPSEIPQAIVKTQNKTENLFIIFKPNQRSPYIYVLTHYLFRLLRRETSGARGRPRIDPGWRRISLQLKMIWTEDQHHEVFAPATPEPLSWSTRTPPRPSAVSLPRGYSAPSRLRSGLFGFHHRAER